MVRTAPCLFGFAAMLLASASAGAAPTELAPRPAAAPYAISAGAARKSEALLGAPSRLAALMARQQGAVAAVATTAASTPMLRSPWTGETIALTRPTIVRGRPDVFGSVALDVSATPLDRRWQAVADRRAGGSAAAWAQRLRHLPEAERMVAVNRFVNARIAFVDDQVQFGRGDVWQPASDALRRGRGDCEDYAIAKLQLLRAAGFAASDLFLVIAKDLVRRSDHAVLAVASEGRLWVLDNGTDRVTDSAEIRDYRPIFTYAAGRSWTHGYRRTVGQPVQLAAATPTLRQLPVPAAAPMPLVLSADEPRFSVTAEDLLG